MDEITKLFYIHRLPLRVRCSLHLHSDTQCSSRVRLLEIRIPWSKTLSFEDKNLPTELHPGLSFVLCMFVNWEFIRRPLWVPPPLSGFSLSLISSENHHPILILNHPLHTSLLFGTFSPSNNPQKKMVTAYCSSQSTWHRGLHSATPTQHTRCTHSFTCWLLVYHMPSTGYALWFPISFPLGQCFSNGKANTNHMGLQFLNPELWDNLRFSTSNKFRRDGTSAGPGDRDLGGEDLLHVTTCSSTPFAPWRFWLLQQLPMLDKSPLNFSLSWDFLQSPWPRVFNFAVHYHRSGDFKKSSHISTGQVIKLESLGLGPKYQYIFFLTSWVVTTWSQGWEPLLLYRSGFFFFQYL